MLARRGRAVGMPGIFEKFANKAKKEGAAQAVKAAAKYAYGRAMSKIRPFMGSYSQFGEDLEIERLLGGKKEGFYVDVGANDPDALSNTKRFYKKGWRGINIEPNAANLHKFRLLRPRDINLNIGIGPQGGEMEFYLFDPHELSTFSAQEAQKYQNLGYKLVEKKPVGIEPLRDVLQKHAQGVEIDFLSVDAEGYDLEVLKSNDWQKFRPRVLCVEITEHASGKRRGDIEAFLAQAGYLLAKYNGLNGMYVDGRGGHSVINNKIHS
ncbi:MAG: FkbM family methyltransferase [Candidatus Micrarchaeota archaeon]